MDSETSRTVPLYDESKVAIDESGSIGEKIYIRTNAPKEHAPDGHLPIFRIRIVEVT